METPEFKPWPSIPRLSRECVISEKIDGTNSQIYITDSGDIFFGSRNKWIDSKTDNAGFVKWAEGNKKELLTLGPGRHYGEWWGQGIQRRYLIKEKRFSLFNCIRWVDKHNTNGNILEYKQEFLPECCYVVPKLYQGLFETSVINDVLQNLSKNGSYASPEFMDPEGIIIFHIAAQMGFKKTIKNDESPKSKIIS